MARDLETRPLVVINLDAYGRSILSPYNGTEPVRIGFVRDI